jgi:hypothetical protein
VKYLGSHWLQQSLAMGMALAIDVDSEKARSEFIIAHSPLQLTIEALVIALVEAKKGILKSGLGQPATQGSEETSEQSVAVCIAEMVAAQRFNQEPTLSKSMAS